MTSAQSLIDPDCEDSLSHYETIFVGFSGGLDSTVLLHHVAHIPNVVNRLRAVHINHGLSVHALDWSHHCQRVCDALGIPLIVRNVVFDTTSNIEENARVARYQAIDALMSPHDCLLVAHHRDDQAETVLLQLLRGSGVDGLAAMPRVKRLAHGDLVRPFLNQSRDALEAYAQLHDLVWINDESNQSIAFTRNYLRHQIMPKLLEKWPAVVGNLVACATHCQQAQDNLAALARMDCTELVESRDQLSITTLQTQSRARIANAVRYWLKSNHIRVPTAKRLQRLIEDVILARGDRTPILRWDDVVIRRYRQTLFLLKETSHKRPADRDWPNFPEPLSLGEAGASLGALESSEGLYIASDSHVQVRFRQGGELFNWHGQTKSLKKLLQAWGVPPWKRDTIPLVYVNGDLVAVVGYAQQDNLAQMPTYNRYRIVLN